MRPAPQCGWAGSAQWSGPPPVRARGGLWPAQPSYFYRPWAACALQALLRRHGCCAHTSGAGAAACAARARGRRVCRRRHVYAPRSPTQFSRAVCFRRLPPGGGVAARAAGALARWRRGPHAARGVGVVFPPLRALPQFIPGCLPPPLLPAFFFSGLFPGQPGAHWGGGTQRCGAGFALLFWGGWAVCVGGAALTHVIVRRLLRPHGVLALGCVFLCSSSPLFCCAVGLPLVSGAPSFCTVCVLQVWSRRRREVPSRLG